MISRDFDTRPFIVETMITAQIRLPDYFFGDSEPTKLVVFADTEDWKSYIHLGLSRQLAYFAGVHKAVHPTGYLLEEDTIPNLGVFLLPDGRSPLERIREMYQEEGLIEGPYVLPTDPGHPPAIGKSGLMRPVGIWIPAERLINRQGWVLDTESLKRVNNINDLDPLDMGALRRMVMRDVNDGSIIQGDLGNEGS